MVTTTKIRELEDARSKAFHDFRGIVDKCEADNRDPTAEEEGQLQTLETEIRGLKDKIDRLRFLEKEDAEERRREEMPDPRSGPDPLNPEERKNKPYVLETRSWGRREYAHDSPIAKRGSEQYRNDFWQPLIEGGNRFYGGDETQLRSLQADVDTQAGYLTLPTAFLASLIKAVDDMVWIRQWARVIPVPNSHSLGVPARDTDMADSDWTPAELTIGDEDTALAYGKRELTPRGIGKLIKLSTKLIRLGVIDAEAEARDRLAYKMGITQEKAFMTGSGAQQPLGLFTASSSGISTGRDVSTDNTTTAIAADNLKRVKYTLKLQHRRMARWLFHRDAVSQIMRLKDGNGQYLIQEGIASDGGDVLLGLPMAESEYAPNTFTTGQYVGMLGNFSNYWIADGMQYAVQRLVELYAATNQIGLISRQEVDGMPVLEEAFVRVTLA